MQLLTLQNGRQTLKEVAIGSDLVISNEGTPLSNVATTLDFVGSGVIATGSTGVKTISIPGLTIQDEGSSLTTDATTLNFVGGGVIATGSTGVKTISIPGLTIQDEGSSLATDANTLNFVGSGVTVTGTGSSKTISIPGTGGGLTLDFRNITISANLNLLNTDATLQYIKTSNSGVTRTVFLPSASTSVGRLFYIINENPTTVTPTNFNISDGAQSISCSRLRGYFCHSNGVNWYITRFTA